MTNKRWMLSVLEASAGLSIAMPWQRGARRAAWIARRRAAAGALAAGI